MAMLSYERELELSDYLASRLQVLEELRDTDAEPNPEQQRALNEGDQAAAVLVEAYIPYIRSVAWTNFLRHRSIGVEVDDLINVGVVSALKCTKRFNARGTGPRPGVRFNTYAGLAINKDIKRYISKMSTPLRVDVSVIQASWAWLAAKAELAAKLGRPPTDEEVEQETEISASYVDESIPHRAAFVNLSDPDTADTSGASQLLSIMDEEEQYSALLRQVLDQVFASEVAEALLSYLGVDRHYPRTIKEVASHLRMTQRDAGYYVHMAMDAMSHPVFRVRLQNALRQLGGMTRESSVRVEGGKDPSL